MPTKQGNSPKLKRSASTTHRGHQPGDKIVNRSKKSKPLPRIKPGETLLDTMSRGSFRPTDSKPYTSEMKPPRISFVEKQLVLARQLFAQKSSNRGATRRLGADTLFEQYEKAKPLYEGSKQIRSKTGVAKANAYAILDEMSPSFRENDNRVKAFKAGIQDAIETLIAAGHSVRTEEA